jgi:hypothetical protein
MANHSQSRANAPGLNDREIGGKNAGLLMLVYPLDTIRERESRITAPVNNPAPQDLSRDVPGAGMRFCLGTLL